MKKLVLIAIFGISAVTASAQWITSFEKDPPEDPVLVNMTKAAIQETAQREADKIEKKRKEIDTAIGRQIDFINKADKSKKKVLEKIHEMALKNMDLVKEAYPGNDCEWQNVKTLYLSLYDRCSGRGFPVRENKKPVYQRVGRQIGNGIGEDFEPKDNVEMVAYAYFVNIHNDWYRLNKALIRLAAKDRTMAANLQLILDHPYWIEPMDGWKNWESMKLTDEEKELEHSPEYRRACLQGATSFLPSHCLGH